MIPRLVPEISPLDAFCDVVVGIGDSRSWMFWQVSLDINNYDMDSMLLFEVTKVTELESIHVKTKMQLQCVSSHICELHYP